MSDEAKIQERSVAAMGASVVAALVTNPFDVVKTRLQIQLGKENVPKRLFIPEKLAMSYCPSCGPIGAPTPPISCTSGGCFVYHSSLDAMKKIVRREGLFVLWRGTGAAMITQIPLVGIYMPLYECMLQQLSPTMGVYAPLLAGSAARSVSVLSVAPLELIKTRIQASGGKQIVQDCQWKGWRSLWRGVDATLSRDIPFSMIYWMMVEPIRKFVRQKSGQHEDDFGTILTANIIAGSAGGAVAAVFTTPFDVAKTTVQAKNSSDSVGSVLMTMQNISRAGGVSALFTGVGPRVVKIAPACAIVVSMYEVFKQMLAGKFGS